MPSIFQARSNSASVVCSCPVLAAALIQMAPLYRPAVQEQLFFFRKPIHVVFSSVPQSPSAIIYHTAVFNFLPSVALSILLSVCVS